MSDAERAIGRLEGKVDLVLLEQQAMRKDIQELKDTKTYGKGFKAAIVGLASLLGALGGFVVSLLRG